MKQKWLYRLAGFVLLSLILLLPFVGSAAGSETAPGDSGGDQAGSGGTPAGEEVEIVLDIYRVGGILTDEATGEQRYELLTATGGAVSAGMDSAALEKLTQEVALYVLGQENGEPAITPLVKGKSIGKIKGEENSDTSALNGDWVSFLPKEEKDGIYLLVARGAGLEKIADYTMFVEKKAGGDSQELQPEKGEQVLVSIAKSAKYTYEFAPLLEFRAGGGEDPENPDKPGTDPGNTGNSGNSGNQGGSSNPDTGSQVVLKPGRVERNGSLEIVKTLLTYKAPSPATFVFSIEAAQADGKVVYSDVLSLTFTEAGQKSVRINNIPVGAKVTVREVYSGSSYTLVSDNDVVVTIPASGTVTAAFVNDYNKRQNEGYGITNHFEYGIDPETGISGWEWLQLEDNSGSTVQKEAD